MPKIFKDIAEVEKYFETTKKLLNNPIFLAPENCQKNLNDIEKRFEDNFSEGSNFEEIIANDPAKADTLKSSKESIKNQIFFYKLKFDAQPKIFKDNKDVETYFTNLLSLINNCSINDIDTISVIKEGYEKNISGKCNFEEIIKNKPGEESLKQMKGVVDVIIDRFMLRFPGLQYKSQSPTQQAVQELQAFKEDAAKEELNQLGFFVNDIDNAAFGLELEEVENGSENNETTIENPVDETGETNLNEEAATPVEQENGGLPELEEAKSEINSTVPTNPVDIAVSNPLVETKPVQTSKILSLQLARIESCRKEIKKQINDLKDRGEIAASSALQAIYDVTQAHITQFHFARTGLSTTFNAASFKQEVEKVFKSKKDLLDTPRGCQAKRLVGNLLILVAAFCAGIVPGAIYTLVGVREKKAGGNFFFVPFHTQSYNDAENLLNAVQEAVDEVEEVAPTAGVAV